MMNAAELRKKDCESLHEEVIKLRRELLNLRFQQANSQLENTARVRQVKRQIARMKTIMTESTQKS